MKNPTEQILLDIGLTDKESGIYTSLLGFDSAMASELAKKTDINRTTSYDTLNSLIKKGLVSKYKKKSHTYFRAMDPGRLLAYLDHEKSDYDNTIEKLKKQVEGLLPALISLQQPLSNKPKVQFFESDKGMREAYDDTLTCKSTILAYANVEENHKALPNFFPEYYKRRAKKKIPIHAIFTDNKLSRDRAKLDKEELRQTKFLPNTDMTFSPEINIYNNKMLVASWKEKMAIIIESKEMADLQKLIHKLLWDSLK
jgi:HTH-type transcriptional regulator, sugar sensing transcriptional regulator